MVRILLEYFGRVLKRSFTGTFIVVDIVGAFLLVLSLKQPKVPIIVSALIFLIIFIFSSFLVWREVEEENKRLRIKIADLKDGIPEYKVEDGVLEKFSMTDLIKHTEDELEQVQAELRPTQSNTLIPASDSFLSAFKVFSQLSTSLPSFMGGSETLKEKEDRLINYLKRLKDFEKKLEVTYKVPLYIVATRSDGNVELKIEPPPECELIVEDSYIKEKLPRSRAPSLYGNRDWAALATVSPSGFSDRLYPYSYAKNGVGYSKLNKMNASQKYRVFDEDFYIRSDSKRVELKITVHSERLNDPQILKLILDLNNFVVAEIN